MNDSVSLFPVHLYTIEWDLSQHFHFGNCLFTIIIVLHQFQDVLIPLCTHALYMNWFLFFTCLLVLSIFYHSLDDNSGEL